MKKYLLPLLLRLLRYLAPGSAFLCLNACFRPLLAAGISIYVFKQGWEGVGSSRHELGWAENVPRVTITLLLVKNGLNYRHWACSKRSCLSPSAPLSSGLFFGYHFRYLFDDDL